MRKFFILCLMAFVMCSCNNSNVKPLIQNEIISGYTGVLYFDDVIPTTKENVFLYEYDTKGRLTLNQRYEKDFLFYEERIEYNKNKVSSWASMFQLSADHDKNEYLSYKKDGKWYKSSNEEISQIEDEDEISFLETYDGSCESFFIINSDDTFIIKDNEEIYVVGKITQYDKHGNWIKAVAKDNDSNYIVFLREITYYN